ncbi:MAG: hypothetical protein JNM27_21260 [Leptospirales bacterium]|nr:hypothetical protein [Leptospirales bacterium]
MFEFALRIPFLMATFLFFAIVTLRLIVAIIRFFLIADHPLGRLATYLSPNNFTFLSIWSLIGAAFLLIGLRLRNASQTLFLTYSGSVLIIVWGFSMLSPPPNVFWNLRSTADFLLVPVLLLLGFSVALFSRRKNSA